MSKVMITGEGVGGVVVVAREPLGVEADLAVGDEVAQPTSDLQFCFVFFGYDSSGEG
jgi:hypothetical protein